MVEFATLESKPNKCNLYCYGVNNPVNNVDYLGYDAIATILDIATLVVPFIISCSPLAIIAKILKAFLLAFYIARIGKAIYDILKAKKKLKKNKNNSNELWTIYTSWIAIIVNAVQLILTIVGIKFKAFSNRVKNSIIGVTLSAMNKVWGTAFFGALVIADIANMLLMGKNPKKRKLG